MIGLEPDSMRYVPFWLGRLSRVFGSPCLASRFRLVRSLPSSGNSIEVGLDMGGHKVPGLRTTIKIQREPS